MNVIKPASRTSTCDTDTQNRILTQALFVHDVTVDKSSKITCMQVYYPCKLYLYFLLSFRVIPGPAPKQVLLALKQVYLYSSCSQTGFGFTCTRIPAPKDGFTRSTPIRRLLVPAPKGGLPEVPQSEKYPNQILYL
jgi:hypothetical protein